MQEICLPQYLGASQVTQLWKTIMEKLDNNYTFWHKDAFSSLGVIMMMSLIEHSQACPCGCCEICANQVARERDGVWTCV